MADYIETLPVQDARLRVEFLRQADRYGHVIQWIGGDVVHPLLSSVEGTPADLWPPSPVLQQLHIEDRRAALRPDFQQGVAANRRVALLVGMAGRSHWSLSVEPDIATAALVFDVACRVHGDMSTDLGSTYQPLVAPRLPNLLPKEEETTRCVLALMNTSLVTLGIEGLSADLPGATLRSGSLGLSISPQQISGTTMRWKYRVELTRV